MRARAFAAYSVAALAAVVAVLTAIWAEWIEALTGWDPDRGDGSLEWLLVTALAVIAAVFAGAGRRAWLASAPAPRRGA